MGWRGGNLVGVLNSNMIYYSCLLSLAYISTSINDGPGCLMLRCPDPSCGAAIGQDMIDELASDEDKEKYGRYLRRSYVEDSRKVRHIFPKTLTVIGCINL